MPAQIPIRRNDIYGNIEPVHGAIPGTHMLPVMQAIAWPRQIFDGPPVLPVHHKSDLRLHSRVNDGGREPFQLSADLRCLPEDTSMFAAFMGHNRAVELLRASLRLAPLEIHNAICSMSQCLKALQANITGTFLRILRHPVDLAGRLLHHQVRLTSLERTHQVMRKGRFPRLHSMGGIKINGNDIKIRSPGKSIHRLESRHEISGDGNGRSDLTYDTRFNHVALEQ